MEIDSCIIGGGPAGLMAAIFSARADSETFILESNTAAGRKLLLTGGGRCNITNNCGIEDFLKAFGNKSRFIRHCIYEFTPDSLRNIFEEKGLSTKVLKDSCAFPTSERSSDVRDILVEEAKKAGAQFIYNKSVENIIKSENGFTIAAGKDIIISKKIIIATGGLSYPQTGSTGDGHRFAKEFGHTVIEPKPALVPLVTEEKWSGRLAGTALENVFISAYINRKKIRSSGNMLFTQDGIGGPAVLDLSRLIIDNLFIDKIPIPVSIDTISGMNNVELERKFLQLVEANPKKTLKGILSVIYPQRFAETFCEVFGFDSEKIARQLEKEQRKRLLRLLKNLPLTISSTRPIEEATITRGGVSTNEINPKTMESKICPGLYFAGEVIDVDGPCGGFNLQFAFSSGRLAGLSAAGLNAGRN